MSLAELSWLALAAYAVHMLEEYMFDWRDWARAVIGLPVEWSDFYMTNAIVVVLGIVQAELAPTLAIAPLTFAALMLINATFFHVAPFLWTKGRFSPGLVTALILFYPIGIAIFLRAHAEGRLDIGSAILALIIGAILMAFPIVMLRLKSHPYFRQI
ncbi:HXXEE domain-containing protein [Methyloferula stellata]|uniref:HXXEE domain-containing protein n=1 Tax=Methyloferula stellata TaxID=876270 RepID=UPI0003794DFF|nr:HXXEE domain-containing protein [Methyloferula stellata]